MLFWFLLGPKRDARETTAEGEVKVREPKGKNKSKMDGCADDLTHTHTGANQYLPELHLTFTFKTALKEHGE